MKPVRIYTTPICPYCVRAKSLLTKKGVAFEEVDVFMDMKAREEMLAKPAAPAPCRRSSSATPMSAAATSFMPWSGRASSTRFWPEFLPSPAFAPTCSAFGWLGRQPHSARAKRL